VYGTFPTLAAFGLGMLQSMIDRIPAGASKPSVAGKVADRLLAMIGSDDKQLAQVAGKADKQGVQLAGKSDKPLLSDDNLLAYLAQAPQASDGEIARYFGKTRQAIQQRRKKLIERGVMAQAFAQHEAETKVQS
jgi:predicted HTH transcriptional regulator